MADWNFPIAPALARHLVRYTPVKPLKGSGPEHLYLAEEAATRRLVVIKLLQEEPSTSPDLYSRRRQLLIRSGVTLSKLRHPNIIETYDFGASPDGVFVVMEYMQGGSLEQKLAAFGALGVPDVASMARGLAGALDYAHEEGLVHCDIRPDRVGFDAAGMCRLTGFAAARSPGATSMGGAVSLPGSLVYAAPEQLMGNIVAATDQFSLAGVMYRALTGRRPFRATEVVALIRQILTETPEPPSRTRPGLPRAADAVFAKALMRNPEDRFRDCSAFADALDDALGTGGNGGLRSWVNAARAKAVRALSAIGG
jgi:serine/threonine-protein kinase